MTFEPGNTLDNHLNEQFDLPEEIEERFQTLKDTLEDHAKMINRKDTGQYETLETNINQTFPGANPQTKRTVLRTVVDFGALPNNATKTAPHNITNISNITFTRIYGTSTQPGVSGIPLPFATPVALNNNILLQVDSTNVRVVTGANYSAFTRTFIIVEYVRS